MLYAATTEPYVLLAIHHLSLLRPIIRASLYTLVQFVCGDGGGGGGGRGNVTL